MSLVTLKEVLEIAERTNTAIPGFNIDNIEIPEAIMEPAGVDGSLPDCQNDRAVLDLGSLHDCLRDFDIVDVEAGDRGIGPLGNFQDFL